MFSYIFSYCDLWLLILNKSLLTYFQYKVAKGTPRKWGLYENWEIGIEQNFTLVTSPLWLIDIKTRVYILLAFNSLGLQFSDS